MIVWDDIKKALPTLKPVEGGFSNATRGIVTLEDGRTAFVKVAVSEETRKWVQSEIRAYHWLEGAGYKHAPQLLAESEEGFALPDLSSWDWEHVWHRDKVDAALEALAALANLPNAEAYFTVSSYDSNPWKRLPDSAEVFASFIDEESVKAVDAILANKDLHARYIAIADKEPWQGTDLVHYDARADNFAYDHASRHGCFVDWNWAGLGSAAFDRTALLVNVQLAGFDILPLYHDQVDRDSLIWLMGFWLERATGPQNTEGLKRLRPRQVANALQANQLLARL